jgi:hypothetical protein
MIRCLLVIGLLGCAVAPIAPAVVQAAPAPPGAQPTTPQHEPQREPDCASGVPFAEQLCDAVDDTAGAVLGPGVDAITGAPGAAVGVAGGGVLDQLTRWMTDAARWVTGRIQKLIERTSTPELQSDWYRERFASMVSLGAGLSVLVAMIALGSAGLRRDPDALGATCLGMFRAGIGTGIVLALVVLALGVADGITNWVAADASGQTASKFWGDVASAWGGPDHAGFGSSAIAFLFAVVQVIAGIAVWIEMLLRQAGIYVAVLFMPAALAASIWPPLRVWQSRLVALLFVMVAMKPVIVVVLSLAGSAAAAGGDADKDLGILVAAVMILSLAAFTPWVLMMLVSLDHEGSWSAGSATASMKGSLAAGGSRVGGGLGTVAATAGGTLRGRAGGQGGATRGLRGGGSSPRDPGGGSSPSGRPPSGGPGGSSPGGAGAGASGPVPVSTVAAAAGLVPPPASARRTGSSAVSEPGSTGAREGASASSPPPASGEGGTTSPLSRPPDGPPPSPGGPRPVTG